MRNFNPDFVDIVKDVTEAVRIRLQRSQLLYIHGFVEEINNSLIELSKNNTTDSQRYPAILLIQPFRIQKGADYYQLRGGKILIAINTLSKYKAADRYTHNFYPILFPIYNAFLELLVKDSRVAPQDPDQIEHEMIELPFYGVDNGGTANIFSDMIDCIMIDNLSIKLKASQTC